MFDQNESGTAPGDSNKETHYCQWDDKNWGTLIHSIKHGNCILMLGPDTSFMEDNGKYRPLSEILANELAEEIRTEINDHIDKSDLAQVSQYYRKVLGAQDLQSKVEEFYQLRQGLTSSLHQDLAALPFYFTITTTFDNLFINALRQEKKEPIMGLYNFKGAQQIPANVGEVKNPLVFYLFGNIECPTSLVLSESDLLEFLVALISRKPGLQDEIQYEIQKGDKIFLFLGFGFRHWYLRILLHDLLQLKSHRKDSRSFAMENSIPRNDRELQDAVFFFKNNDYNIHIFKQDFRQFAKELRHRFEECTPQYVSRVEQETTPEVFICHANENEVDASKLCKELEAAGLRPWLDKEKLRGGDKWHSRIEQTINRVNYFVVLVSDALNKKIEGYVHREIYQALDRQKNFRPDIRFVIPVKIEKCDPREEKLKELHAIDLYGKTSCAELIKTIERDFEKRKKQ